MTEYSVIMLVINPLGSKDVTADLAAEVLNMVFLFGSSGIGATQGVSAAVTNEVKSPEEVGFAINGFIFGIVHIRIKLCGDYFTAILLNSQ
jgi:hypothetical protein